MTLERRRLILAITAGLLVGGFALDRLIGPGDSPSPTEASAGDAAAVGTPALAGAPRDLDAEGLEARYQVILDEEPFRKRSFRPERTPRARPSQRTTRRPEDPPPPSKLELRLTGLLGQGEGRVGVLEERGSGKGILAHVGLTLGDVSVVSVTTDSIVLAEGEQRRTLSLGDELTLPKELASRLVALKATTTEPRTSSSRRRGGESTPPVEVSADDRKKILERLRNQRRNSLTQKKPEEGGSQ